MIRRPASIVSLWGLLLPFIPPPCWAQAAVEQAGSVPAAEQGPIKQQLAPEERQLLRRPDEKRPEERFTVKLWGRPLTIGGTYELRSFGTVAVPFKDRRVDDQVVLAQRGSPELFYRLSDRLSLFLKANAVYRSKWKSFDNLDVPGVPCWDRDADRRCDADPEDTNGDGACTPADCTEDEREDEGGLERDEMWLYAANLMETPVSVQVGRQRVFEDREWWWDEDLDMFRLHFDQRTLHFEAGLAQLIGRVSTDEDHIDPEEEDVLRLLARGTWEWTRRNRLEMFFLRQWDRSGVGRFFAPGQPHFEENAVIEGNALIVDPSREDPSDADLTWLGLSARGRWKLRRLRGRLYYWADTAIVRGRETALDFGGKAAERKADGASSHSVRGWGLDLGMTWATRLPGRLSFTVGYAVGSGDSKGKDLSQPKFNKSDIQEINDRSFRQTGLQRNNARFRGVDRFKYYGELLEPELSNLRVGTASVGFRFLKHSSVELLYHLYRQVDAAKFLRSADVRRQPAGRRRGIGHELDLVIGIEEWEHVEIELVGSAFRAGPAFGAHCDDDDDDIPADPPAVPQDCPDEKDFVPASDGDWSYLGFLKFKLNF
jgi:hypothetical protein